MRAFLLVMAAIFILGGAVTIAKPKTAVVSHQGYRYKTGSAEVISKDQSVVYGAISLGFGAAALFAGLTSKKWYSKERT